MVRAVVAVFISGSVAVAVAVAVAELEWRLLVGDLLNVYMELLDGDEGWELVVMEIAGNAGFPPLLRVMQVS